MLAKQSQAGILKKSAEELINKLNSGIIASYNQVGKIVKKYELSKVEPLKAIVDRLEAIKNGKALTLYGKIDAELNDLDVRYSSLKIRFGDESIKLSDFVKSEICKEGLDNLPKEMDTLMAMSGAINLRVR